MGNVYTETIVDYYQNPRKKGTLPRPTAEARKNNPSCGDVVQIQLKISKGRIEKARFLGAGCAISTAAASLLMEKIEGMKLTEVRKLGDRDALALLGIDLGPARLGCALLPFQTMQEALSIGKEKGPSGAKLKKRGSGKT
jgi:nitrogen fixation NifU-like protein